MPTLHGTLPDQPGPTSPCRWCGAPTDLSFAPEGTNIGPVPLHMLCAGDFILTVERLGRGLQIKPRQQRNLDRVNRLALTDGHAATSGSAIANVRSPLHDLQ
jgi:hypothetical protein